MPVQIMAGVAMKQMNFNLGQFRSSISHKSCFQNKIIRPFKNSNRLNYTIEGSIFATNSRVKILKDCKNDIFIKEKKNYIYI